MLMRWELTSSLEDVLSVVRSAPLITNRRGNPGTKKRKSIIDLICAFDIEDTRLPDIEQAIMYVWQWKIGPCILMGRTWEDFLFAQDRIASVIEETHGKNAVLVSWVHNLSHEFSFLKGIYPFKKDEVFCMDRRKVLRCSMAEKFEFRCSYIHSNMSLDMFCKKMNCKTRKLTGTFDYDKIRYPWTELTHDELMYCVIDVICLCEAIENEMILDDDNLATIPLTSTGYVRRDAKAAMHSKPAFYSFIRGNLPDYNLYCALREAFRGGNTHASRFYSGAIIPEVKSMDRSSSYPDVLVNRKFPIAGLIHRGPVSLERYLINTEKHNKAYLIRVAFFDIELADEFDGCPYLAKDKCRLIHEGIYDNGRILRAKYLETTLTDIDARIVFKHYVWSDICIFDSWSGRYGYLPDEFRDLIKDYYRKKTALKGDPGQSAFYDKIKNKINALYGMTAQNPVKEPILFDDGEFVKDDIDPEELLIKYNRRAFLVYQWGVWVTAHARNELQKAIDISGDNFVYTDTDSVKYIGDVDFSGYNKEIEELSISNGAYAVDAKGETHIMGVYESESIPGKEYAYDRFITWGAKKYAYEINGKCGVTCAGVNKKTGGEELEKHGGLEAFKPGFVFRDAGGTEAVYNDNIDKVIKVDGRDLHITDNVVIRPSSYTLGITGEYKMLLHRAELVRALQRELDLNSLLTI